MTFLNAKYIPSKNGRPRTVCSTVVVFHIYKLMATCYLHYAQSVCFRQAFLKKSRFALQEPDACLLNLCFKHFSCYRKWFAAIRTALQEQVSYMLMNGLELKI